MLPRLRVFLLVHHIAVLAEPTELRSLRWWSYVSWIARSQRFGKWAWDVDVLIGADCYEVF